MFKAFLIKYAEIGVKGKNRYLFEDALVQQTARTNFNEYLTGRATFLSESR